jgi:hypothetical protein
MKANGSHHIFCGLAMTYILMVTGDFTTWMDKIGGGFYLYWTLFQYFDNCHVNIGAFCTDCNNVRVFYMGRPASELGCSALTKVALAYKAAKNHFDQLILLKRVDSTVPSICGMSVSLSATSSARAEPKPRCARVVAPSVATKH